MQNFRIIFPSLVSREKREQINLNLLQTPPSFFSMLDSLSQTPCGMLTVWPSDCGMDHQDGSRGWVQTYIETWSLGDSFSRKINECRILTCICPFPTKILCFAFGWGLSGPQHPLRGCKHGRLGRVGMWLIFLPLSLNALCFSYLRYDLWEGLVWGGGGWWVDRDWSGGRRDQIHIM